MSTNHELPSPSYVHGDSAMAVIGRPVIVPRADALRLVTEATAILDSAPEPEPEPEPTYRFGSTTLTESEALWLANRYLASDVATEREWSPGGRTSRDVNYGMERAHAAVIGTMGDPNDGQRTKPRKRATDPRERVERQVQRAQRPTTTLSTLTTERDDIRPSVPRPITLQASLPSSVTVGAGQDATTVTVPPKRYGTDHLDTTRLMVDNGDYCLGTYLLVDGDSVTVVERRKRKPGRKPANGKRALTPAEKQRAYRARKRERELRALLKEAAAEQDAKLANAREDAKRAKQDAVATSAAGWAERD